MKAKDWLYIAGISLLAVLLLRAEFCTKPKVVEVVRWRTINLDSLKAQIEPVKIEVPGPERQVLRYVTVTVVDQQSVDSLAARYAELANKYSQLKAELEATWDDGQGQAIEWATEQHSYTDSVTTPEFFHRWEIVAEGPIVSYSPTIIPFCPIPDAPKAIKQHRVGAWLGVQTGPQFSPIVGISYRNRYFFTTAGYLPNAKAAQVGIGIDIGVR